MQHCCFFNRDHARLAKMPTPDSCLKSVLTIAFILASRLVTMSSGTDDGSTKDLHLMVMLPFSGSWSGGESMWTSIRMGLEQVNTNHIIPGYRLVAENYTDTKCDPGWGMKGLYENIFNRPTKIMILGACCSSVTEALSRTSQHWNLVQLSPASVSPALSDKNTYPLFARLTASDTRSNPARLSFFKHFHWSRICTIHHESAIFSQTTEDLIREMRNSGMKVELTEMVSGDPSTQVKNLKDHDCRIIVGAFYEDMGRKVLCQAYKQGLYGPHMVWVLTGWMDEGWWLIQDASITCTEGQMRQTAEGYFDADFVYLNPKEQKSISGLLPSDWRLAYKKRVGGKHLKHEQRSPQGTDAVWAIALALNATRQKLIDMGNDKGLEDFTYSDSNMSALIYSSLLNVSFMGVRGNISFDSNGDIVGTAKLDRVQDGKKTTVGWYNSDSKQFTWSEDNPVKWKGGIIPLDKAEKRTVYVPVSWALYVTICTLAALGVLLACAFLAFNVALRDVRLVKMSSPRLNNVILAGCICCYASVFVEEIGGDHGAMGCQMKVALMTLGSSLALGALFAKTWRVYIIFTNTKGERKILTDAHLFAMVGVLVLADVIVIGTWSIVDPSVLRKSEAWCSVTQENDGVAKLMVELCEHSCRSDYQQYFLGTLYSIHALVLLFGTFLAFETRHVKYRELNDSKYIGMCIYLVSVLCIPAIVLSLGLDPSHDTSYAVGSGLIIVGTTITQCIIFLPKLKSYRLYVINGTDDSASHPTPTPARGHSGHNDTPNNPSVSSVQARHHGLTTPSSTVSHGRPIRSSHCDNTVSPNPAPNTEQQRNQEHATLIVRLPDDVVIESNTSL